MPDRRDPLEVACPTCFAAIGQTCNNARKGTKWVHAQRQLDADARPFPDESKPCEFQLMPDTPNCGDLRTELVDFDGTDYHLCAHHRGVLAWLASDR